MKLKPIQAYTASKRASKEIFILDDSEGNENVWIRIKINNTKDAEEIRDCDFCNIRELGEFQEPLLKLSHSSEIK